MRKEMEIEVDRRCRIEIFPDRYELATAAAAHVARWSAKAQEERGRFTITLSGGSLLEIITPKLLKNPLRNAINWAGWHVFWADERCVPHGDPASNYGNAHRLLLDKVPVPPRQIHPMADTQDAVEAARAYEVIMKQVFQPEVGEPPRFDLILLGVGEDGHTASLFPRHPVLEETAGWTAPVFDAPKPPSVRVTLTLPVINNARHVAFVVCGAGKASILSNVFGPDRKEPGLPVQNVCPSHGDVQWFVDRSAAFDLKMISNVKYGRIQ